MGSHGDDEATAVRSEVMAWRLRPAAIVVSLLLWVAGGAVVYLSMRELERVAALGKDSLLTDGVVIDTRIMRSRAGTQYELRYHFTIDGQTYGYSDATGRDDLWIALPRERWSQLRAQKTLRVRYAPSDPRINTPDGTPLASADHYGGFILAGLIVVTTVGLAWQERRALVAGRPSPVLNQRRFPGKAMFWRRS